MADDIERDGRLFVKFPLPEREAKMLCALYITGTWHYAWEIHKENKNPVDKRLALVERLHAVVKLDRMLRR